MNRLANIISVVFHPIFHPIVVFTTLFLMGIRYQHIFFWPTFFLIFVTTILLPVILLFLLKKINKISSINLDEPQERALPLLFMAVTLYLTNSWFSEQLFLPFFTNYLNAMFWITVTALIVSFFWKISLHALGWGGLVGTLSILLIFNALAFFPLLIAIFLAGATCSARLILEKHTEAQIYLGFCVGFIFSVILL